MEMWNDQRLLSEKVKYLSGEPLKTGEKERYFVPSVSGKAEDVYAHALRAIHCALERGVGEHGLLKMGTGDWNDGMNEVGAKGEGESVWLTWFAVVVLDGFLPLVRSRSDSETEELCRAWAQRLREAAQEAWDGQWFLRGWYDDGKPLGSHLSDACQLDSIPQSWAVLAGGDRERCEIALRAALERLFDREAGSMRLFTPAYDDGPERPGYIRAYVPGIRENGGQYTHAAAWAALACFRLAWTAEGYELLRALLPATHPQEVYEAEPYVLAGDVYSHPSHLGRGGWSWYTGAAGWYHQAAVQGLLGITVKASNLTVRPQLPKSWPGWSACWRGKGWQLNISVRRGQDCETRLDGRQVEAVELRNLAGEHALEVTVKE